jgi:hypothetical protein
LSREDLYYGADDDDAADDNFVLVPIWRISVSAENFPGHS